MSTREGATRAEANPNCRYPFDHDGECSPPSPAAAPEIDPTIVGVKSVEVEDGRARIKLTVSEQVATMLAGVAFDILESQSAENYVEMLVAHPTTGEFATLTVRRSHRPTPHELRRQAEERVRTLQGELEEMREAMAKAAERLHHGRNEGGLIAHPEFAPYCPRCILDRALARAALSPKDGDPT